MYFLGWSEGTIISPLVALNNNVKVDGLLLCGYCNENLLDTFVWQQNGNASIIFCRRYFDYDRKGYITKSDFEEDRYHKKEAFFGDLTFEQIDIDGDGKLTAADFAPVCIEHMKSVLSAVERSDDEWLKNNHGVRLTSEWWKEHFSLEPNKNVLPRLDLPIHIFSGEYDYMTPLFHSKDIEQIFKKLGKTNLTVHYFDNDDHNLNFSEWVENGEMSEGMKCLFEIAESI